MWSKGLDMTRFCLIFTQVIKNINLPKVCGLRNQVWPRFYLTFTQVISMTHNVTNKNMAELPFINNNTFIGYLHSRGAVQHFRLDLLGSIHLYQLPRWYGMTFPNNFPYVGFFVIPTTFLNTKSPRANGLNFTLKSYPYLSFCW